MLNLLLIFSKQKVLKMIRWLKRYLKHFITKRKYPHCKLYFSAAVNGECTLGSYVVLFPNSYVQNSKIGDCSYIQKNTVISHANIGNYCSIASNVTIGVASHPTHMLSTSPVFYDSVQPLPFFLTKRTYQPECQPLTAIGADVWIGQGVIIKAGVTIGVGAVIGAGAVVTKNIEPYSITAGVPAKHLKWRFNEETRNNLIKTQWWKYSFEELESIADDFEKPERFITSINNINSH